MLLFLDTEFTDFTNCDLISIGLISEDGQYEFYAERTDFNYGWCNDFVRSAVWAQLGEFPKAKGKKHELAERLREWLSAMPYDLVIACDSMKDWDLLKDALDGNLPSTVTGHYDMRHLTENQEFNRGVSEYHKSEGHPLHHALHDAKAQRLGWLAWNAHISSSNQ